MVVKLEAGHLKVTLEPSSLWQGWRFDSDPYRDAGPLPFMVENQAIEKGPGTRINTKAK